MELGGLKFFIKKIIAIFLAILMVVILGYMLYYDSQEEKRIAYETEIRQQNVRKIREESRRQEASKLEYLMNHDSFYQKLADRLDVNILIVGDSIAAGAGASKYENSWAKLVSQNINKKYNVKVNLTNVSMGGNSSYAGYVRTLSLDDDVQYDLVILCYGQNDIEEGFSIYYESLIRAVKNKYEKASIICILESSQKEYTPKMKTIQAVAQHYGLPVADTIVTFKTNYDSLTKDAVHPNDEGHKVYCETVMNVIEPLVAERYEYDPSPTAVLNEQVTVFDKYQLLSIDKFTREGNSYYFKTNTKGVVLGIDYSYLPGKNKCDIYIDGMIYKVPEVSFNYDFSQHHISVVNKWLQGETVNIKNEIKVVFSEDDVGKKQADEFNGFIISG